MIYFRTRIHKVQISNSLYVKIYLNLVSEFINNLIICFGVWILQLAQLFDTTVGITGD